MPSDFYPIEEVQPEWVLHREDMGGKRKFWYRNPDEETTWLFKYPRKESGEHWAEKIAAEIAGVLEIPCARVELAVFNGIRGSASESFLDEHQELFLGNQILARHIEEYDPDLPRFEQSRHTLENIWVALEHVFEDTEGTVASKVRFAEFLVLDAIIGNTDRHSENWGVARRSEEGKWVEYLAWSFDHASSLGRELQDVERERRLNNSQVSAYSESPKGRGGIFWSDSDKHGPHPLELVRLAFGQYKAFLEPSLEKLASLGDGEIAEVVVRVPRDWMSDAASSTTTSSGWWLHPPLTAGGAASFVGAAGPFVA